MLFTIWSTCTPFCKFHCDYLNSSYGDFGYAPVTNFNFPSTFAALSQQHSTLLCLLEVYWHSSNIMFLILHKCWLASSHYVIIIYQLETLQQHIVTGLFGRINFSQVFSPTSFYSLVSKGLSVVQQVDFQFL